MELQAVFGNPRVAKSRKRRKLGKKRKKSMAKRKNPAVLIQQLDGKIKQFDYTSGARLKKLETKRKALQKQAAKLSQYARRHGGELTAIQKEEYIDRAKKMATRSAGLRSEIRKAKMRRTRALKAKRIAKRKGMSTATAKKVLRDLDTMAIQDKKGLEKYMLEAAKADADLKKLKKKLEKELMAKKKKKAKKKKATKKRKAAKKKKVTKKKKATKKRKTTKKKKKAAKKATKKRSSKKKSTRKKKATRKSASRKKVSRKKASKKKRSTRKKVSKKRRPTRRRRTSAKKKVLRGKKNLMKAKRGQKVKIGKKTFKRVNPQGARNMKVDNLVKKLTAGHTLTEALTLAAGGAGLSVLDAALKKYVPANLQQYGVVGGVNLLPAAVAAVGHEYVRDKRVRDVAKAIVAASVVRTASKGGDMVAESLGLAAPGGATSGVKFIPKQSMGKVQYFPDQMGAVQDPSMIVPQDRGDFNGMGARQYQNDADFQGVEYFPNQSNNGMGAVVGIDPDTPGDFEGYPEVMAGVPVFDPEEDDV